MKESNMIFELDPKKIREAIGEMNRELGDKLYNLSFDREGVEERVSEIIYIAALKERK